LNKQFFHVVCKLVGHEGLSTADAECGRVKRKGGGGCELFYTQVFVLGGYFSANVPNFLGLNAVKVWCYINIIISHLHKFGKYVGK
jgi:hypothetical protein